MTSLLPRRLRLARALLGATLLLAAACSGSDSESMRGGAVSLPGPVPEGVSFHDSSEEGVPAPVFTVDLVDGTPLTISDLWGQRPVVLLFTSSWCTHCAEQHVEIAELVASYEDAVALVAVAGQDDHDSLVAYTEQLRLDHPVALEADDAWLKYAVREPPLVALVGPGGRLVRGWPGGVDAATLEAEIEALFDRT